MIPRLSRATVCLYWARVFVPHIAHAALWLVLLAPFTVAAPQMSPAQVERAINHINGKLATLEELVRKVEKANEIHQESGRSHPLFGTQVEAQAVVLQAHTLRMAEYDAVIKVAVWAIGIAIGLLGIIAGIAVSLKVGYKKVITEHHEICELLRRMDQRAAGGKLPG